MRVLHTALLQYYSSGVVSQMYSEYLAAKNLGIDYDVKIFMPQQDIPEKYKEIIEFFQIENSMKLKVWVEIRKKYYQWLLSKKDNVDIFLLRYIMYDPYQYLFIRNNNKKVLLVHHTLEIPELRLNGFKGRIQSLLESFWGNKSIKLSYGIVGVTNEIVNYERQRAGCCNKLGIVYPNGIALKKIDILDLRDPNIPEILFVASYFYDWHGLDLLIKEMKKSEQNIIIHIVGSVKDSDLENLNKDKRFIIHSSLSHDEIEKISARCWVALGSFALFRKNIQEGSTLKVREYLSNGLPVFSGHKDVFPESFEFYKNESLNIESILEFAYKMRTIDKVEVRNQAENYISKEILLKEFYDKICKDI